MRSWEKRSVICHDRRNSQQLLLKKRIKKLMKSPPASDSITFFLLIKHSEYLNKNTYHEVESAKWSNQLLLRHDGHYGKVRSFQWLLWDVWRVCRLRLRLFMLSPCMMQLLLWRSQVFVMTIQSFHLFSPSRYWRKQEWGVSLSNLIRNKIEMNHPHQSYVTQSQYVKDNPNTYVPAVFFRFFLDEHEADVVHPTMN